VTALIGDVIIPLSHGFNLGPFILGCALASIVAFLLVTLNGGVGKERAVATRRDLDRSVNRGPKQTGVIISTDIRTPSASVEA
jgi:hypothetical protein